MQVKKSNILTEVYAGEMKTGRPAKTNRSEFGSRLHGMREESGLSQQQIAEQLGISQPAYASWERRNVAIKPKQLAKLANIFDVNVEALFSNSKYTSHRRGPVGKMRRIFDEVSVLPRNRQQRIVAVVEDMLMAAHQFTS